MIRENLDSLRTELSIKSKNGVDFVLSASIVWLILTFIWKLSLDSYDKSVLVFIAGSLMLPMAFGFSRLFRTNWKNKDNPLQPLGLWLNFAQLFYFPFLFFFLIRMPDTFIMAYAIITGAHFFPYAWFYRTSLYAISAGVISLGAMFLGLLLPVGELFVIPLCMSGILLVLFILLFTDSKRKERLQAKI